MHTAEGGCSLWYACTTAAAHCCVARQPACILLPCTTTDSTQTCVCYWYSAVCWHSSLERTSTVVELLQVVCVRVSGVLMSGCWRADVRAGTGKCVPSPVLCAWYAVSLQCTGSFGCGWPIVCGTVAGQACVLLAGGGVYASMCMTHWYMMHLLGCGRFAAATAGFCTTMVAACCSQEPCL